MPKTSSRITHGRLADVADVPPSSRNAMSAILRTRHGQWHIQLQIRLRAFRSQGRAVTDAAKLDVDISDLGRCRYCSLTHRSRGIGLTSLFPPGPYIAWLDRYQHYPEAVSICALCHPAHRTIMRAGNGSMKRMPCSRFAQTHDSYVWQKQVINQAEREGLIRDAELSGEAHQHSTSLIQRPARESASTISRVLTQSDRPLAIDRFNETPF